MAYIKIEGYVSYVTYLDPIAVAAGRAVRAALTQCGMTQEQLSEKTGISLSTLSRRINGSHAFSLPELFAVAEVTGADVVDLVAATNAAYKKGAA